MGAFFQELTPEIKVTVDENSKRHSMTTTYIHKLNLGVNMANNMRHALTGFAQTWKKIWPCSLKSAFCPRIVLVFCKIILESMNKSLKNIKNTTRPFRFMGCAKKLCENCKKTD